MISQNRTPALLALLLLCLTCFSSSPASSASPDHWVGTWATAPFAASNRSDQLGATDSTLREIVHVSLGGSVVRIALSNEFGLDPLTIGAAQIALSNGNGAIGLAANPLTFGGHPSVTIPPRAMVVSDPAVLKFPAFADLAVSLFVPAQPLRQLSQHGYADQTSYITPGNLAAAASLDTPKELSNWIFLKGVDIQAGNNTASIVTFGDSITEGYRSTRNANARWPDLLARRLQADRKTADLSVLNEGIGGNRVLHDTTGPSALARFDRDVLAQPGVRYVVIMESINDIGRATDPTAPRDVITSGDLIFGLGQLATRAHTRGLKVIGATLTPFVGASYQSPAGEVIRQAVNQWIRTSPQFDGVIDFDKVTSDPTHPGMFLPLDDSGDHLHPGDIGYKAMADSIDLKLFTK